MVGAVAKIKKNVIRDVQRQDDMDPPIHTGDKTTV